MAERTWDDWRGPRVVALDVADGADAWAAAGFAVEDDDGPVVRLGTVALRLTGSEPDRRGITGWTLSDVELPEGSADPGSLDGLPTTVVPWTAPPAAPAHPNGTVGLDHVVVATPDLDRTLDVLAAAGLDLRRTRDATVGDRPMRQAFFRLGPTILEVVSSGALDPTPGPATFWGLAVDVEDLDATAALLGPGLGRIKQAVQPRRRIATLRHRDLGLSASVAAMDRLGARPDVDR